MWMTAVGRLSKEKNIKNFIKFFAVIIFLCISFTSCGSMVLEPDVYTHIKENDLIYYTEKGNERVCDPDSVIIGVRQDGRDRYACTERLQLYFYFVAGEDTKRFDLQSVKLKNLNTGEVIVTEENEGKVNPSRFKYKDYLYNKDGTNMIQNGQKLCNFCFYRGHIPTNPFNNNENEEIQVEVEITYTLDLGETLVSKSKYNVKIGGLHYDPEGNKKQILSTLYW